MHSSTNKSPHKLFKSPVLNRFIKTNSLVVIRVYVGIAVLMTLIAYYRHHKNILLQIMLFLLGLVIFTLVEYLMHRFVYHSGPDYMDPGNWQYKSHGVHHQHPRQKDLLAMPLPLALLLLGLFFGLFYLLLGYNAFFLFPGFALAYAAYLYAHYKIHSSPAPKNFLKYLWKHHHRHHHKHPNKAYGLTSPLWDFIFGTIPPANNDKDKE